MSLSVICRKSLLALFGLCLIGRIGWALVLSGKIHEINPAQHWVSIDSADGLTYLVLHPHGFVFKKGERVFLTDFAVGDEIAALTSGIRNGNTVLTLAIEDKATYDASAPSPPQKSRAPMPPQPPPPQPTASSSPRKTFLQIDGEVQDIAPQDRTFFLRGGKGEWIEINASDQTKIYAYTASKFILLSFDKLKRGARVKVGGFLSREGTVKAESVLILPAPEER